MSLKTWLEKGRLKEADSSPKLLSDLKKLIERDLEDAQVTVLSNDRRFATAYNAALNLSNYVIREKGYRVSAKAGHHQLSFEVASFFLGPTATKYLDYFDLCRRKRNKVDYDFTDVVTETEVQALIATVKEFKPLILK